MHVSAGLLQNSNYWYLDAENLCDMAKRRHQPFGLAASIAARLTICPISLACSASDFI
jgi:hypothetical protein